MGNFPCRYLGIQLAIKALTRADWQPLLDQVRKFIPAWQRGLIQRSGRLILVKSVIAARPIHQLMVLNAPEWVFEDIDKWMRSFFWAGKDKANGRQCLVAWDTVCRPTRFGGLGVKDIRLQAIALRVRWEWLRRVDQARPWQGLRMIEDKEASLVFNSMVKIVLGNGANVLFWKDRWIHGFTVGDIAPLIVELVQPRARNRRSVQQALDDNAWIQDVHGDLTFMAHLQVAHLCQAMATVPMNEGETDQFVWPADGSGCYSAKSVYNRLCMGLTDSPTATGIWRSWAPLRCKIFAWLLVQYRLWTSDRRARHGLQQEPSACFSCLQEEDNVDHIFAHCVYAREVWHRCFEAFQLNVELRSTNFTFKEWWLRCRENFSGRIRRGFDSFIIGTAWALWKQRNARVFNKPLQQRTPAQLVVQLWEEMRDWKAAGLGVGGLDPFVRE